MVFAKTNHLLNSFSRKPIYYPCSNMFTLFYKPFASVFGQNGQKMNDSSAGTWSRNIFISLSIQNRNEFLF